jgi:hypothetical protein
MRWRPSGGGSGPQRSMARDYCGQHHCNRDCGKRYPYQSRGERIRPGLIDRGRPILP